MLMVMYYLFKHFTAKNQDIDVHVERISYKRNINSPVLLMQRY